VTTRRDVLLALAASIASSVASGQQPAGRTYRLGVLSAGGQTPFLDAFFTALRELGYVEQKNLLVERRFAEGNGERLPPFAAQLVNLRVDVIVTIGERAAFAARDATSVIPIVFPSTTDPARLGLVASLAKPGGNITGTSLMAVDLSAKRLELLQSLSPRISRIAMLWDPSNPGMAERVKEAQAAADRSRVVLRPVGPRTVEELETAFAELAKQRPDALLVTVDPFTRRNLARILEFCVSNRVPCMFEDHTFVEAGGLISYGPDLFDFSRRAATYVDKIFKGSKPADLPIEQPTKFDLVINLKTAKALGLAMPQSILVRADRIIE